MMLRLIETINDVRMTANYFSSADLVAVSLLIA